MRIPPHYTTLGVDVKATSREIHTAYRRLAKRFHPDINREDPEAEERFKEIGAAYKILGDVKERRRYDRAFASGTVKVGETYRRTGYRRTQSAGSRSTRAGTSRRKSRNVKVKLFLTIEEACKGGLKRIKYPRDTICLICDGTGKVEQDGSECKTCSGNGIVQFEHTVKVNYPAGMLPDETLVMAGEGHINRLGIPPGDLQVTMIFKPHLYLEVKGRDLHYTCLIGLDQYIQGGRLNVPTISRKTVIYMEPRISDGERIQLTGRGLPGRDGEKSGNLVITIRHCLPKKLSSKEMEKVKELMRMTGFSPPVDKNGMFPREEV